MPDRFVTGTRALAMVTFRFPGRLAPGAKRVAVVGTFNNWSRLGNPMTPTATGDWAVTLYLPSGRVLYLFDVDGDFWLDPDDDGRIANGWGGEYSVKHVIMPHVPNRKESPCGPAR